MFPNVGKVSGARASSRPSVAHIRRVCTELTWWMTYHADVLVPAEVVGRLGPRLAGEREPALEQRLRVGRHPLEVADADLVVLGRGARDAADEAVGVGAAVEAAEHHRRRARAERQARELLVDVLRHLRRLLEPLDRRLVRVPRALAVDDQRVRDLAGVDRRRGEVDRVDEAEARVAEVEVEAAGREAEVVMDGAGDRRLEVVPADRGVDEHPDLGAVDAGCDDRLLAGERGRLVEAHLLRPPAALGDPGELLEQPGPDVAAGEDVGQLLVDPGGGDDLGRLDGLDRDDADVRVALRVVAAHAASRAPARALNRLHFSLHLSVSSSRDGKEARPGLFQAERAGFEPAKHLSALTRFPVALLRPLGHLSVAAKAYPQRRCRSAVAVGAGSRTCRRRTRRTPRRPGSAAR